MEVGRRRRVWTVPALAGLAAYGWWATGLRPFTVPALAVTLATGAVVIAAGARNGLRHGAPAASGAPGSGASRAGLAVWAALLVALVLWELAAFLQHPRSAHPTLSALANLAFDGHAVRAAAFALWMAAGYGMARR